MSKLAFDEALKETDAFYVLQYLGLLLPNKEPNMEVLNKLSGEQKACIIFGIEYYGKHVVADLFQLGGAGGTGKERTPYDKELRKMKLPKAKITAEYMVKTNFDYKGAGRYYDFREADTKEFWRLHEADLNKRLEADEKREQVTEALTETLTNLAKKKKASPSVAPAVPASKKAKKVKVWGVDENFEVWEGVEEEDKGNYQFTGTEKECDAYATKNAPKPGTMEAFKIEMKIAGIPEDSADFEEEKNKRITAKTLKA